MEKNWNKIYKNPKKKLKHELLQKIINLAGDKTTNEMSSRKIANLINEELEHLYQNIKGKKMTITHPTIC